MTQGIERTLNLPPLEEALREHGLLKDEPDQVEFDEIDPEAMQAYNEMVEHSNTGLPNIAGKDHEVAMDGLYQETLKHARSLMDYGMNIDHARARGIFEVATTMYGKAIDAKNSKRDAQIKAMKLMLESRKLDLDEKRQRDFVGDANTITAEGSIIVEDRNDLIKRIREQRKNEAG